MKRRNEIIDELSRIRGSKLSEVYINSQNSAYNSVCFFLKESYSRLLLVAKLYCDSGASISPMIRCNREWFGMQLGNSIGIAPCPIVSGRSDRVGSYYIMYEFVCGMDLRTSGLDKKRVKCLGEVFAKLHTANVRRMNREFDGISCGNALINTANRFTERIRSMEQALKDCRYALGVMPELQTEFLRRYNDHKRCLQTPIFVPTHGDVDLKNVINGSKREIMLIDWEYFAFADPSYEIANLFWFPEDRNSFVGYKEKMVDAYLNSSPARNRKRLKERIVAYDDLLCYFWILKFLLHIGRGGGDVPARVAMVDRIRKDSLPRYISIYLKR